MEKVTAPGPQVTGDETEKCLKQQRPIKMFPFYKASVPRGRSDEAVDLVH